MTGVFAFVSAAKATGETLRIEADKTHSAPAQTFLEYFDSFGAFIVDTPKIEFLDSLLL